MAEVRGSSGPVGYSVAKLFSLTRSSTAFTTASSYNRGDVTTLPPSKRKVLGCDWWSGRASLREAVRLSSVELRETEKADRCLPLCSRKCWQAYQFTNPPPHLLLFSGRTTPQHSTISRTSTAINSCIKLIIHFLAF
ncbi:hypothetical protein J6590_095793 [Homalodisca vitripennis]|nr:hypothetical protein J6590_067350 [Homalodisca vitripennis]KAG8255309.1 hypothetical protein J6590_095793 [Homalodisca vitripennis]